MGAVVGGTSEVLEYFPLPPPRLTGCTLDALYGLANNVLSYKLITK